jgi:hypothetical protein
MSCRPVTTGWPFRRTHTGGRLPQLRHCSAAIPCGQASVMPTYCAPAHLYLPALRRTVLPPVSRQPRSLCMPTADRFLYPPGRT